MINGSHTFPYKIKSVALFAATAISFYALSLLWFAYCFVNGSIDREMFFNSDALFIPSLFKNLFTEGKHFSDWLLPPSSFIFPDALLYGIAYILSKNVFTQILILAILQSVAFFFLVSALLSQFFRHLVAITYSALISANIIILGLYFSDPFGLSFLSSHHFGSLLSLLMLSILLLKFTSASTFKIKFCIGILSVVVTALSVISDRLILLHLIAPILLIAIFFSYTGTRQKEILKFGLSLLTGILLAFILEKIYISRIAQLGVGFGSLFDKSILLANWTLAEPWLTQLTIISLPISLLSALLFLRKNNKSIDESNVQKNTLALFILVSTLFTLFVTGLSSREFTPRYLLPYLFLSPIFLFLFLPKKTHKFLATLLFFSCIAGFFTTTSKEKMSGQFYDTYPEFVKCVDTLAQKHAVTRGVAQFWDAFPLYVFSSNGLSVAPVIDDVSPMKWIYNASDFAGDFSFAVIDNSATGIYKISKTAIERQLTNKPFEYQCFGKTVLIFNNETITLPQAPVISNLRSSALESFIKNPRALLIMAQGESASGNNEAAARLISEAVALLRQAGASSETIRYYETIQQKYTRRKGD